jgi:preprotein translocase SecE subunit
MASAAVQSPPPPTTPASEKARLLAASAVGAGFILAGVALAGYGVPTLFRGVNLGNGFINAFVRVIVQLVAIGGLAYLGGKIAGANPPKGLRGGIFLLISAVFTFFFLVRTAAFNFGDIFGAVAAAALAFGLVRLVTGRRGLGWMHALEEQGWFHTNSYKRSQGRKMRQYTLVGIAGIGLSGTWALRHSDMLLGDLVYRMPFGLPNLSVLTDAQFAVPLLLALAVLWFAWRAVNIPAFADFLIATEAEMNKVSWSSRKRLVQDTIVVLVTTLLLTLFLLVIDLFWGWFLADLLGVLPKADPSKVKPADVAGENRPW